MKWKSVEQRREYYRKWRENHREQLKIYQRRYYQNHRPACLSYFAEYAKNHPQERKVINIVNNFLKNGKIKRGYCIFCNKNGEAHHFDYNKPLEITWLCKSCHKKLHLMLKNLLLSYPQI